MSILLKPVFFTLILVVLAAPQSFAGKSTVTKTCEGTADEVAKCQADNSNSKDGGKDSSGCVTGSSGQAACDSAKNTCNMISPQAQALISQALSSAKNAMSTTASTDAVALDNSAASACNTGATMAEIAGTATMGLAVACELKISACLKANTKASSGEVATDATQAATTNRGICTGLQTNVLMDGAQMLQYFMSYEQNKQCAAVYKAAALAATPKTCAEEPTRADCICVINPSDPSCLGQTASLTASTGFSDSSLRGGVSASDPSDPTTTVGAVAGQGGTAGSGMPGAPAAGGANGPSLLGGKSSPDAPDGGGAGPYNTNVISGTTSGGGGSPYARAGSGGEGGENSSLLAALANKFNLKKYLPGQARGLASTGRDGMTGATGPSIWDKVSTQYNRKKSEMVP